MNWDDEDDRGPAVARRPAPMPNNFVAPAAIVPVRPRVEVLPPAQHEVQPAQPVQTLQRLDTSHVDRAKGFTITALPLSLALGVVALLLAGALFGVPWLSALALLVLFGVFTLAWLVAYVAHQSTSPDGVALWQVLLGFVLLSREQKARLERMRRMEDEQ